ncbi:DUF2441 domain-containing protein [Aeromonas salmonicida]|uniref:DUF2441 domain-containing protein n=1 Tax=Aeromonas salmonicida TaxID=645 RepID=UPI003F7B6939
MEYFHINHTTDYSNFQAMTVGGTYETSLQEFNPYYNNVLNGAKRFNLSEKNSLPILDFFKRLSQGQLDDFHQLKDHRAVAQFAHDFLSAYIKIAREMHFENVRTKKFTKLPSRQHCIWLAESLEDAKYWVNRLAGRTNCRIFRVEVDGRVFKTNEGHLIQEAEPYEDTLRRANEYWNGTTSYGRSEVLFEGSLKVLEHVV